MLRLIFFPIQKLLEVKSNIKQANADFVFTKPYPPESVSTQQRGIKRSHDVGKSIKN